MGCSQWLFFKAIDSNHTDATYDCYDADTDINNSEEKNKIIMSTSYSTISRFIVTNHDTNCDGNHD